MSLNSLRYTMLSILSAMTVVSPAFLAFNVSAQTSQVNQTKPNIIFILADDLGYGDLGSYGQDRIKTPNLDRMAQEGMRFTQFYSGSSVCRPARCTLMLGLHTGNCYARANNIDLYLREKDLTIAEVLKEQDYATATIGKWALGDLGSTGIPTKQGFDYFYGYLNQTHAHNYYPEFLIENTERVPLKNKVPNAGEKGEGVATVKKEYSNDLFTHKAVEFIAQNKDNPFFLYLPYTLPHANNEAGDDGLEVPSLGIYEDLDWSDSEKAYAAMVTRLDSYVGRLIEELKQQNIDQNTFIFFTGDNGPHQEGGYDPESLNSNSVLRGSKRDLYEGGIRVPMIAWAPGTIAANQESDLISYLPDIYPTIVDLAGIEQEYPVDGLSLYPTLIGDRKNQKKHEFLYWEFHAQGGSRALRMGNWKSVVEPYRGKMELYDLNRDPSESSNIASEHPDIISVHQQIMEEEHQPLPPMDNIRLFFARETIFQLAFLAVPVILILLILILGSYVLFRLQKNKIAS